MNPSMISASVTMGQLQKKLDTISNNMANSNTTGFKRREASFSDLLHQQVNNQGIPQHEGGRQTPDGLRVGAGARIAQTAVRMEQGSLQETERQLDLALTNPSHFFQIEVETDDGQEVRYTRDGAFYLSPSAGDAGQLNLVTANGDFVLGADGPVTIPADYTDIVISDNGVITVTGQDGADVEVGQLELVNVERPQLLTQAGDNAFALADNLEELGYDLADVLAVIAQADVSVRQGFIENSNVDLGKEMTDLLETQRAYQFNGQSISMADQMMGLVNNLR
ncbi:flagellar hook-basal body protein [Desertibacillus haloalkaliphilus]|uniref:flagellar hook-basal body protein n=1 Tax=Desertibacillus haloalkaliphilus TaxID=1328930 RepID=UPI001C261162|nr:flagellar hook-basal body protein [Desertibacillus haloalkaliphilus]MBU8905920.1 flagellar hook-basal body protein [Desertibacillus haloalkaliphilus]